MKRLREYISSCFSFDFHFLKEFEDAILRNSPAAVEEMIGSIKHLNTALPGMTPLELALSTRSTCILELLLKRGARVDVRMKNHHSPVFYACANGYLTCVKLLVAYGASINSRSPDGYTCLLIAVENGYLELVSYLLGLNSCDVDEVTRDGFSALHYIALLENTSLMSSIIDKGANINAQTRSGETAVFLASKHKCLNSFKMLLEAGADVNIETTNGSLPLHETVDQNNIEATQLLLKHGADATKTAENGLTPIAVAVSQSSLAIMMLLLDNGADIEQRCARQWTPLLSACDFGFLEGVRLLVDRGADLSACSPDGSTCLRMAANNRHRSVVSYLLELDSCDVNEVGRCNHSPLHYIVQLDDPSFTSHLIAKGADINARTSDGESPVFLATKNSCLNSLRALLRSGADPNVCTYDGKLALYEAVRQKNLEATRLLLNHGADVSLLEQWDGVSALGLAIDLNDIHTMALLLDHGADIEQTCPGHLTSLMAACIYGFFEIVRTLIERGADIGARTPDGLTSLLLAARNRHSTVVTYLLCQDSCTVTDTASNGYCVLHYVALMNHTAVLRRLLSKGVDINARTEDGKTAVFLATKNACRRSLKVLLESGADPNISTKNSEFAIHEAVRQSDPQSMKLLLEHGADRTKLEKDGLTLLRRALRLTPSNPAIVEFLLSTETMERIGEDDSFECVLEGDEMHKLQHKVKQCVYCPILFEVMRDPVIAADGHTYERKAIEYRLRQKKESPVTRKPLESSTLIPNIIVRHLINQYMTMSARK